MTLYIKNGAIVSSGPRAIRDHENHGCNHGSELTVTL